MSVFDEFSGRDGDGDYDDDRDLDRDEDLDHDDDPDNDRDDRDDDDRDPNGRRNRQRDRQDGDRDDTQRRRRNRPGARQRDKGRIERLEGTLNALTEAIRKGGLAVNLPAGNDAQRRRSNGGNGSNGGQTVDVEALRSQIMEEVTQEVQGKANARMVRTEARAALKDAGFRGNAARGVSMLDLTGIDADDDEAILEAIEDLKEDSPELFGRVRRNRSRTRDDREDYDDSEDNYRPRESRPARSREQMSRSRGETRERDSLADSLSSVVGSGRRPR